MRLIVIFFLVLGVAVLVGAVTLRVMRSRDETRIDAEWDRLLVNGDGTTFDPATVAGLPDPARRFLQHAIEPGARLPRSVDLRMEGDFLLGPGGETAALSADERIAPMSGFVWRAVLKIENAEITGAEMLAIDDSGVHGRRTFWHGFLPGKDDGPDLVRSLKGRAAIERVFLPSALLPSAGVTWSAVDASSAAAAFTVAGDRFTLVVTIADDDRLKSASLERWGIDSDDRTWTSRTFTIDVLLDAGEQRVAGIAVPKKIVASWGTGDGRQEFLRTSIGNVALR